VARQVHVSWAVPFSCRAGRPLSAALVDNILVRLVAPLRVATRDRLPREPGDPCSDVIERAG
jgi:hypothetical protein